VGSPPGRRDRAPLDSAIGATYNAASMDDTTLVDLLGQIGSLFTSSLELKENIDFMLRALTQQVGCDVATIFLLDEDQAQLRAMATFPYSESVADVATFKVGEGIVGWSVAERRSVSVRDATRDPRFKELHHGDPPRSALVMPLASPRRVVGALTLARKQVKPFTALEQALAQVLANQASISIDNATLHAAVQKQLDEIAVRKHELEIANAQVRENSRLKSEFLANMSHELRTPLNSILGFSEILKDNLAGALSAEQQHECLENIYKSGRHLLSLVNDVLDLSKVEAGRMELQYEEFLVDQAIDEVLTVIRPLAERGPITLSTDTDGPLPRLRADKSKFKQILYNLLSNAIKFTPEGGQVTISARIRRQLLEVSVTDTGIGIDREHHDRIFSEFYQVPGGGDRTVEGTGLGLALVQRLVQLHGGTVRVASQLGSGSAFAFTLPVRGLRAEGRPRNRILLIEDNPSNRELSSMVLRGHGFQVEIATDGQEGLRKAKSRPYDLILTDVRLPGIDGLTITRLLKADPKTAQMPVVALSARAMVGDEGEALAAGCTGYITKPIEVKRFVEQVSAYLEAPSS